MTIPTEIEVQNTQDADPAALIAFFEKADMGTIKTSSMEARGETGILQVILTIAGTWAAERYVLDPLADRFQEWLDTAASLEGRQFKVSIRFEKGRLLSIETFRISNPLIVRNLWRTIKSASDLLAGQTEENPPDRVLIVPGKSSQPLVIGYHGTRPTHLLDLSSGRILPIEVQSGLSPEEIEQAVSSFRASHASTSGTKE